MRQSSFPLIFPFRSARSLLPTRHLLQLTTAVARGSPTLKLMSNDTKDETSFLAPRHFSQHQQTPHSIGQYYIGAVILFGFLGNLSCLVACRLSPTLRRSRFGPYLIACSIADTIFLLCLGLVWLKGVGVHWHDSGQICTMSTFLSNTTGFLSAWFVAAMTLELTATIRNPYRIYALSTSRLILAKKILFLAAISLLVNTWTLAVTKSVAAPKLAIPAAATSNKTEGNHESAVVFVCQMAAENENVFRAFTIYDIVLSVAAPLIVTLAAILLVVFRSLLNRFLSSKPVDILPNKQEITFFQNSKAVDRSFENQSPRPNRHADATESMAVGEKIDLPSPNRLQHFAVQLRNDSDRERKILVVAVPSSVTVRKIRPQLMSRRRPRHLIDPAKYHAMLHRQTLERCLKREELVKPLLTLKSLTYLVSTLPHFVFRLWLMLGDGDINGDQNGYAIQWGIYFLFYTQFALNAILYVAYAVARRLIDSRRK